MIAVVSLASLPACLASQPPPVRRVVGGRVRTGAWISPYAYEVFVRAELARVSGQLPRAIELSREAIASAPDDPFLLAHLADVLAEAGRLDAAADVLRRSLVEHPSSEALHLSQGDLRWRNGDPEGALRAYGEASRVAPRSDEGPRAMADALERLGRVGEAELVLARFVRRGRPTPALARARLRLAALRGDHETIAAALRSLGRSGGGRRSDLRALARGARLDDPALATTLYRFLVRNAPDDAALRIEALRFALDLGDTATIETLRSTTTALPATLEARALLAIGDPEAALRLLDEHLALPLPPSGAPADVDLLEARALRGRALMLAGRDREAIRALSSVQAGTAPYAVSRVTLADVLARVSGPPSAIASLRAASSAAPSDPDVTWALVRRVREAGDEAGAAALVAEVAGADRALVEARWADLIGDVPRAAAAWRRVSPDRVGLVERQRVLAERAAAEQRGREAAIRLERAAGWAPLDAPLAARAAEILWEHDPARATAVARDGLTIAGAHPLVLRRLEAIASRSVPRRSDGPPPLSARRRGPRSP